VHSVDQSFLSHSHKLVNDFNFLTPQVHFNIPCNGDLTGISPRKLSLQGYKLIKFNNTLTILNTADWCNCDEHTDKLPMTSVIARQLSFNLHIWEKHSITLHEIQKQWIDTNHSVSQKS